MNIAPFYPIVDSAAWVERLTRVGAKLIQLRIKDQTPDLLRQQIRTAKRICERTGSQLIVNDYWQLALEEDCDLVHLGQGDLDSADMNALRSSAVRIGISTHDHAELERALSLQPDYVALGPIYPTLLKQMPWAPQGLERIAEWKRRIGKVPLVAIGGLTVERVPAVFAAGADSAAVVTDIVRNADPERRTLEWIEIVERSVSLKTKAAL
ncbi:MAG: thiamine phosphate synthase [Steroidobacter sp.]